MSGTLRLDRIAVVSLVLLVGPACHRAPVAVQPGGIQTERAIWQAHDLGRYAYVYETTGFLIAWSGRPVRLVVIDDSVTSAQDVATDSMLPAAAFPTIDELFARALAAQSEGSLLAIAFDSTFAYPSRIDLAGPPDASGSIRASDLQLLP